MDLEKKVKKKRKKKKREMTSPSSSSPFKTTLEDFKPKIMEENQRINLRRSLRQPEMSKPAVTQPVVSKSLSQQNLVYQAHY